MTTHYNNKSLNPYAQEFSPATSTNYHYCYKNYHYNILPSSNFPSIIHQNYHNYPFNHPTTPMQPQAHGNLSPNPCHQVGPQSVGPQSPHIHGGVGALRKRQQGSCTSGRFSNYRRKQGYNCPRSTSIIANVKNIDELCKGKEKESSENGEQKKEMKMLLPVKPNGVETTAMIRNIPNQYTREMLINFLDEFCRLENLNWNKNDDKKYLAFDFLYLPMDFRRNANKGYAFVNFTHPIAVWKLHLACHDQQWKHFKSPKRCKINCAAIQGKENLVKHFSRSKFVCDHEDYLPVCFSPPRNGSGASVTNTIIGNQISNASLGDE